MRGAKVGRFYLPSDDGGGVYVLVREGDSYALQFLPRHPDGQVAWEDAESMGEVDFFRIEPELREQAHEAGRILCKRAGLSPAMTRQVLGQAMSEGDE